MKKLLLIFLGFLVIASCQKKETENPVTEQEVTFAAIEVDPGLKSTDDWLCPQDPPGSGILAVPTVAKVIIADDDQGANPQTFWPEVFMLDGKMYTQSIKLPVTGEMTTYYVMEFSLWTDTQANGGVCVMAAPAAGSAYAEYTTIHVIFPFDVTKFAKTEIPVQVLCYMPDSYTFFGFNWFNIEQIVIREQCFFGDLCIKSTSDYDISGSPYLNQDNGVQIDMPALIEIDVKKKDPQGIWQHVSAHSPFTNNLAVGPNPNDPEDWYGEGYPLCVEYPDNLMIDGEEFQITLKIMVRVGAGFGYVEFAQWEFIDAEMIEDGADGVVDFVLGNCAIPGADFTFPPYMNLPPTCTLTTGGSVPGAIPIQNNIGGYFDVTLSTIPTGYEISNIGYGVNCFNRGVTINLNTPYDMNVYSSLYPEFMQGPCQGLEWDQANWLINHLDDYLPYTWYEVQQAFWYIEDNTWTFAANGGVPTGIGTQAPQMAADAIANGDGFVPLPGGWAGVAFERVFPPSVQCIFLRIDP